MANIIRIEFLKLKRTYIWILILGCCGFIPVLGAFINLNSFTQSTWESFYKQNLTIYTAFVWPCILGITGGYLFIRELEEGTIYNMRVLPVNRMGMVTGKLILLFLLSAAVSFYSYLLNIWYLIIGGSMAAGEFYQGLLKYGLSGLLLYAAVLPVLLLLILAAKNYAYMTGIVLVYIFLSYIGNWNGNLASILPVTIVFRLCDTALTGTIFLLPVSVSCLSLGISGVMSFVGILILAYRS